MQQKDKKEAKTKAKANTQHKLNILVEDQSEDKRIKNLIDHNKGEGENCDLNEGTDIRNKARDQAEINVKEKAKGKTKAKGKAKIGSHEA
eukprot:1364350-Heterocapsa_arctica.AAC.1